MTNPVPFLSKFSFKRVLLHFVFWSAIFFMHYLTYKRVDVDNSWVLFVKDVVSLLAIFYLTSLFVIPRWLMKGKYMLCIIAGLVFYIFWAELSYLSAIFMQHFLKPNERLALYIRMTMEAGPLGPFTITTIDLYLFDFIYLVSLPIGMKVMQAFSNLRHSKTVVELENTNLEYGFLKMQVNPHFLFNTLNSIQVLVSDSDARAEKSLQQLSGIMHYLLHVSTKPMVTIEEEYGFLEDYIMLEKLRLREDFPVEISLSADREGYLIAPLVIFTFVENAFKHGLSTRRKDAWIKIKVSVVDGILNMEVGNSYFQNAKSDQYIGGIGLENVKKRLELNYHSKYQLDSKEEEGKYEVLLTVDLNRSKGTFKE